VDGDGRDLFVDRLGQPITALRWARLQRDRSYTRVADDELPVEADEEPLRVSTVWLGFAGPIPLAPFETMVFDAAGAEVLRFRWQGWICARQSHERLVRAGSRRGGRDALRAAGDAQRPPGMTRGP
jgi:hypothetical protein